MSEQTAQDILMDKLREIRTNSIEVFKEQVRELSKDDANDGHDVLTGAAAGAIDGAIIGVLNTVYNHPNLYVTEQTVTVQGDEGMIETQFTPGLADVYFNMVNV